MTEAASHTDTQAVTPCGTGMARARPPEDARPPVPRCAVAARLRGDALAGTAIPTGRFLLLEVPGPWRPEAVTATGVPARVAGGLEPRATAAGVRLLLIRRPGRHPGRPVGPNRWALADVTTGSVEWGEWCGAEDLEAIDPARQPPAGNGAGARPLALVCTHGRHDACCAIDGRPLAALAASDPRVDAWECSHVGGDRFAANLLLLPSGLMFGGLGPEDLDGVLAGALAGRVTLETFRGRCGDPPLVQAVQWHSLRALGADRPAAIEVEWIRVRPGSRTEAVVRHEGRRYRLELAASWAAPQRLTCRGAVPRRARIQRVLSFGLLT